MITLFFDWCLWAYIDLLWVVADDMKFCVNSLELTDVARGLCFKAVSLEYYEAALRNVQCVLMG